MAQSGALPLYQQISELLIRDIASGRLVEGERMLPERDLARDLGIAVGTLRKALAELEAKGMIERVQGSGNYVRGSGEAKGVYAFFRLELAEGGGLPTAEILSVDLLPKPADLPPFGSSPEAHRIRRLRRLSGVVAAVEEIWLDRSYADRLSADDLSESLYLHYRRRLGFWIARTEDRVGVGTVPDWIPEGLPLRAGMTVGRVDRTSWAQDGAKAEISRTWFDSDKVRYVSRHR